jgi:ABC-type ATPase with predicted acetyltransferase domain
LFQGQVPPWAQPQITNFAVQESIVKTVEAAVVAFGITSLSGTEGNVEVNEDVSQMSKGYKEGTSLQFTATLNCALAEVKAAPVIDDEVEATSDVVDMADVVDVEATPVSEE